LLQQWQKRPTAPVVYFLFDLLWCDGRDLTGKTVVQRRERLQEIIAPVAGIQVGGYVETRGKDLFQLAKEKGLEGIIAKRKNSVYRLGKRSPDWLKIESDHGKNLSSADSPKAKEAENILERCFWEHTETGNSVTSDTQGVALQKRD
jgi:ATP-dependent DNA ligase